MAVFAGVVDPQEPSEKASIIYELFEASFPDLYRYAIQSLNFKMEVLEAFVIRQVSVATYRA